MDDQTRMILNKISLATRDIEEHYPELLKYLDERRSTLPQGDNYSGSINNEELEDYLNGLKKLILEYKEKH